MVAKGCVEFHLARKLSMSCSRGGDLGRLFSWGVNATGIPASWEYKLLRAEGD
jgi:hypothetical protein